VVRVAEDLLRTGGDDLPRQTEPVLEPAALALLAAVGEPIPVDVDLPSATLR